MVCGRLGARFGGGFAITPRAQERRGVGNQVRCPFQSDEGAVYGSADSIKRQFAAPVPGSLVRYRTDSSLAGEALSRNRFYRGGMCAEEAHMPGDPKVCRQHAETCRRLATESTTVAGRNNFLNLADTWERLAAELDS